MRRVGEAIYKSFRVRNRIITISNSMSLHRIVKSLHSDGTGWLCVEIQADGVTVGYLQTGGFTDLYNSGNLTYVSMMTREDIVELFRRAGSGSGVFLEYFDIFEEMGDWLSRVNG